MTKYLLVLILVSNTTIAAVPQKFQPRFSVFGTMDSVTDNVEIITTIPFIKGQTYGWIIHLLPGDKGEWKEVLELPSKPTTWGLEDHTISKDGKTCTTKGMIAAGDEIIYNLWEIDSGDPTGDYIIRVYLNDDLIETFYFKVGP
jgi:hypothetical protein